MPGQGLFHYAAHARAVSADGLHEPEDEDGALSRRGGQKILQKKAARVKRAAFLLSIVVT
jgi:hypothetical protein